MSAGLIICGNISLDPARMESLPFGRSGEVQLIELSITTFDAEEEIHRSSALPNYLRNRLQICWPTLSITRLLRRGVDRGAHLDAPSSLAGILRQNHLRLARHEERHS